MEKFDRHGAGPLALALIYVCIVLIFNYIGWIPVVWPATDISTEGQLEVIQQADKKIDK